MSLLPDLPPVERVCAYTPRQGDTIVLKVKESATQQQVAHLKDAAERAFGEGIKIMILGGADFVGVIETRRICDCCQLEQGSLNANGLCPECDSELHPVAS